MKWKRGDNLNRFIRNHRQLTHLMDELSPRVTGTARHRQLIDIRNATAAYHDTFSRMVAMIRQQQRIMAGRLTPSRYQITNSLSAMRMSPTDAGDRERFLALGNLQAAWNRMSTHSFQFSATGDERHSVLYRKAADAAEKDIADLVDLSADRPSDRKNIEKIKTAVHTFSDGFTRFHTLHRELTTLQNTTLTELDNRIRNAVTICTADIEAEFQRHRQDSSRTLSNAWAFMFSAIALALGTGIVISLLMANRITRPLQRVMTVSRTIAEKDLPEMTRQFAALAEGDMKGRFQLTARPLNIRLNDEVGRTARAFDDMIRQLGLLETAFVRMKDQLADNKRQLDMALEAAAIRIWTYNMEAERFTIIREQPSFPGPFQNRTAGTLEEVLPHIHPQDRDRVSAFFRNPCSDEDRWSIRYRLSDPDDGFHWLRSHARPLPGQDGGAPELVGVTQEVTLQVQAAQEKAEKEKLSAVMQTAGAVCHELNQPLQIISGSCEILLEDLPEETPIRERVRKIQAQIKRMADLNHKLMNITSYRTKTYLTTTIIDIDEASAKVNPPPV